MWSTYAIWRKQKMSYLVRTGACLLFGAKPLIEPVMIYHKSYPSEKSSMKYKTKICSEKYIWKYRLLHSPMLLRPLYPKSYVEITVCIFTQYRFDIRNVLSPDIAK